MCHKACLDFIDKEFGDTDFNDKTVLEVGSYDVNGSVRRIIDRFHPKTYMGVDISKGPGVDRICSVDQLTATFGEQAFDVVISTEMLEHVEDWRSAISNLKNVLKPKGLLILTTRSAGFAYHGYPYDYWRYEISDFKQIFADMEIVTLVADPDAPGLFLKAQKKDADTPHVSTESIALYSIRSGERTLTTPSISRRIKLSLLFKSVTVSFLRHLLPFSVQAKLNNYFMQKFLR